MDNIIVLLFALIIGFGIILFFIRKWMIEMQSKNHPNEELVQWLKEMGNRIDTSTQAVDQKLSQNMQTFNERLDKAAQVIGDVQKNIGEFSEIGRSMKDLQAFLQSPKLRGNIGEQVLKDLLSEFLPQNSYVLQYCFKNGEKCDAIIKTSQGLIPVDAKFPMENFRKMIQEETLVDREKYKKEFVRDVKKHIGDIFKKYILVEEGTVDYALMYIPAEAIYYEIINNEELYQYASDKRILMVSPMSFYAYLKAILMSFEGQKIEKRAKEILSLLQSLGKDYGKADEALSVLNRHITNAYNQTNNVSKHFISFGQKLNSTRMLEEKQKETAEKLDDEVQKLPL
ncbi:MAG TPA: DNA recombination protein RmuC [Candidatus Nitrosocosmicus sp.]|nr:DNA recombination protein RmuC [Candidatus Nitrosocosmicus sp.]